MVEKFGKGFLAQFLAFCFVAVTLFAAFPTTASAVTLPIDSNDIKLEVNGGAATATLSNVSLAEPLSVNDAATQVNRSEWDWGIFFSDGATSYSVKSTHFKFEGDNPSTANFNDLQHTLWKYNNGGWDAVNDVAVTSSFSNDIITWSFALPADIDLANVTYIGSTKTTSIRTMTTATYKFEDPNWTYLGGDGFADYVYAPPPPTPTITISGQPAAATVTVGSISGNLTVAARVTENKTLAYQWYQNTANSTSGGTLIDGATAATLAIPTGLTIGDHYFYCVLSADGAVGVTSAVATVTVQAPVITINAQPAAATFTEGIISGNLTVEASVTGNKALAYQWYQNASNSTSGSTPIDGATAATLAIPTGLAIGDHYFYCVLSADGATSVTSVVVAVTVQSPASAVSVPENTHLDITVASGGDKTTMAGLVSSAGVAGTLVQTLDIELQTATHSPVDGTCTIRVNIPGLVPADTVKIVHQLDSGSETLSATSYDGYATFQVSTFSLFGIVVQKYVAPPPSTPTPDPVPTATSTTPTSPQTGVYN